MDSLSNSDAWICCNFFPSSIFGNEISWINGWIKVHITDNLDCIVCVKNFYRIFLCFKNNSNNVFGCFYQVIFFKPMNILFTNNFTIVQFKVVFIDGYGIIIFCPNFNKFWLYL